MMPIVCSWKAIGRGLRIGSGHLDMIQKDSSGNFKECLSEMLTCWLKRNYDVKRFGEPSWRAVVKVVACPAAGDNHALALSIAKQHSGKISYCNVLLCSILLLLLTCEDQSCGIYRNCVYIYVFLMTPVHGDIRLPTASIL